MKTEKSSPLGNRFIYLKGPENFQAIEAEDIVKKPEGSTLKNPDKGKTIPKMSASERAKMEKEGYSIDEIAQERQELRHKADSRLNDYYRQNTTDNTVVEESRYLELQRQLKDAENDDDINKVLLEIGKIPAENDKLKTQEIDENKEIPLSHEKLKPLRQKWLRLCDDNLHLIGLNQQDSFKKYFDDQLEKGATVKKAKGLLKDFEGVNSQHPDGLFPRREVYEDFKKIFSEYHLGEPFKVSDYIKQQGLSERRPFLENAKEADKILRTTNDQLYTPETRKQIMGQILGVKGLKNGVTPCKNPSEQKDQIRLLEQINDQESQNFVMFNPGSNSIQIGKQTIERMSKATQDTIMAGYKGNTDLKMRLEAVRDWPNLMEKETKLSQELGKLYENDPTGLEEALSTWGKMDYFEKQKAIEKHKKMVKENADKDETQREMLRDTAFEKINKAVDKQDISKSTAVKYREWFEYPDKKEPRTLEELKKAFRTLTGTAETKYSLKGFEVRHTGFDRKIENLKNINPDYKEEKIKDFEDRYHNAGWTPREEIEKELDAEITKEEKEADELKKMERASTKTSDKKVDTEYLKDGDKAIDRAKDLMVKSPAEAMSVLTEFIKEQQREKKEISKELREKITSLMRAISHLIDAFGPGEILENTTGKVLEKSVEKVMATDARLQQQAEEHQVISQNLAGIDQSERHHQGQTDTRERARKESLEAFESGSEEERIAQSYWEGTDDTHILQENDHGEVVSDEVTTITMDDQDYNREELTDLRAETYKKNEELRTKRGLTDVEILNKSGQTMSFDAAEAKNDEDKEWLAEEVKEAAAEDAAPKLGKLLGLDDFSAFEEHERTALHRAAIQKIEERDEQRVEKT